MQSVAFITNLGRGMKAALRVRAVILSVQKVLFFFLENYILV
jgi:hypothetical protein